MPAFSPDDITRFISTHLPLRTLPELGIRLHLADPRSRLSRFLGPAESSPYWAFPWAGGMVLALHIIAHPGTVAGRTVLDFGAGSGLVGIVAGRLGAKVVHALDIDPLTRHAIGLNASANTVSISVIESATYDELIGSIDLILAGDVFYDRSIAPRALADLDRARAAGSEVLISDPGRAGLPRDRLQPVATYGVCDVGQSASEMTTASVFRLTAPDPRSHFDATIDP